MVEASTHGGAVVHLGAKSLWLDGSGRIVVRCATCGARTRLPLPVSLAS